MLTNFLQLDYNAEEVLCKSLGGGCGWDTEILTLTVWFCNQTRLAWLLSMYKLYYSEL